MKGKIIRITSLFCAVILFHMWSLHIVIGVETEKAEELAVMSSSADQPIEEEMLRVYLRQLAHKALNERLRTYEKLETQEQIDRYQKSLREFFFEQLGEFPEKTPLNARIVGKKKYDDYRLEKVIYESQPGFYVTANFYHPNSPPPYPGVLVPCGHSQNGKAAYQQICILLAKNGMAALCYDPIGQGERKQVLDDEGQPLYRATTEHMVEGVAPILLGRNLATYKIWDGIRSIDYMLSRDEIDESAIGCTGNSGGGMLTSYLMALDQRIVSAAPSCFITTTRRKNESPGPGDAEQNIHAQIKYGMDHPDYILMRAPKPTLLLTATRDFVPIEGAWESFRQAKRLYTRLGHAERVGLVEADEPHGFSKHLREGAARWMQRWLLKEDNAYTEQEVDLETNDNLQCTPDGQVLLMPNARSIFDLNLEYEQKWAQKRKQLWEQRDQKQLLEKVRSIAGIRSFENLPLPRVESKGKLKRQGYHIEKLVLRWERNIYLPALMFQPETITGLPYLYVHGEGKHKEAMPGDEIESLVQDGHKVLAIDVRGCGETRTTPWRYKAALEFTGYNPAEFFIAYMLGKSFVGMRAEDILVSAKYLMQASNNKVQIYLIAVGETGPAALHATALEPDLFQSVKLRQSLVSWSNVISTPVTKGALINVIHGALKTYDLPNLVTALGQDKIKLEEPVNSKGESVVIPPLIRGARGD